MSNCLMIHSTVAMKLSEISTDTLFADIDKFNALSYDAIKDAPAYVTCVWWFLGRDNVYVVDDHLHINFGNHRSVHTWRDLQATLNVLGKYMHKHENTIAISQSDESDGFAKTYTAKYDF